MANPRKVLILGGTGEGAALARRLAEDPALAVTTSLAGRTRNPANLVGQLRQGGFGGAEGLAQYLRSEAIDLVIDATHPFASQITRNAAQACATTGTARLLLSRPAWAMRAGDRWIEVADADAAAAALSGLGERVFLSTGRQELAAFTDLKDIWFLTRLVDRPEKSLPLHNYKQILARGPYAVEEEVALLRAHGIEALVSKNSGGDATYAKIAAARELGLPVVMIQRTPIPESETVASVEDTLIWIDGWLDSRK